MLRSDFKYTGSDKNKAEFVETVNQLARLINGLKFDWGVNGGLDITNVEQTNNGLIVDFQRVEIPYTPPS